VPNEPSSKIVSLGLLGLHTADAIATTIQFTGNVICVSAVEGVGEAGLAWTKAPANAEQNIPELATWLARRLVACAAACCFRGRVRERK